MANGYKQVDGKLIQLSDEEQKEFELRDFSDEKKLSMLRSQRDELLKKTDWTQNRDVTLSNDADWKTYRQELRDITKTFKSMSDKDFKFPTKPTE
tara:strand:+ start:774 stop:1058 length:285 start_codon:yes stop_codon:yes gene_type:complete